MSTKQLLEEVLAAFDSNDPQTLFTLVTDDFEWNMVGGEITKGKNKLKKMFEDQANNRIYQGTYCHRWKRSRM